MNFLDVIVYGVVGIMNLEESFERVYNSRKIIVEGLFFEDI